MKFNTSIHINNFFMDNRLFTHKYLCVTNYYQKRFIYIMLYVFISSIGTKKSIICSFCTKRKIVINDKFRREFSRF